MASNTESTNKKVAIIIGSTRPVRIGPDVAKVVLELLTPAYPDVTFSILDVADFKLPIFDEVSLPATVPAMGGKHEHTHTINWSNAISKFDGYILLSPEYNFGAPAAVKNAIDYLYHEWIGKPIVILTYGIMGGGSASTGLNATLKGMHLDVVETRPQLEFPYKEDENETKNLNPTMIAAMGGVLHENAVAAWKGAGGKDILKAAEELNTKLLTPKVAAH